MKTVMIPIFHPLDARNILRTSVLTKLIESNLCQVVLLVPELKESYYRLNFQKNNVTIEAVSLLQEGLISKILRLSARMMLDTGSMYWQAQIRFANADNKWRYYYDRSISYLGRFRFLRTLFRLVFGWIGRSNACRGLLKKYTPDLVFLPDIYAPEDIYLGIEAKRQGVRTLGLVRSWDNLTSKGTCLFIPEHLVVHNEYLKDQAQRILGINEKDISVTGLPHFDYYKNYVSTPRSVFLDRLGLPDGSLYILFAPYLGTYRLAVNEILRILDAAILDGRLPANLKIIVRMPPSYNPGYQEVWTSDRILVDYPGERFYNSGKSDWEFSQKDMTHFADSLVHASVILNFASTISIDAAALGRPVINIGFDGYDKKGFAESISAIYVVDHFHSIIRSGGAPMVKTEVHLLEKINEYIKDPSLDTDRRINMVEHQCGRIDGGASERLANCVIDQLRV